ncbi:MAG: signal peptidase II, partial [Nitrospirota bacterium]
MSRRTVFLLTFPPVVVLDQLSKYLAAGRIDPFAPLEVLPFLNLVNIRNVGAAFGLFTSMGNAFFIAVSLVAIALIGFLIARERDGTAGLSLVLAGAVGNLIDRLAFGYVRDFVDLHAGSHHWPAFNVADSALTVGIALLLAGPLMRK